MQFLKEILLCVIVIPIFVAIDAVGVLPIFVNLIKAIDSEARKKIAKQSVMTAFIVTICFVFFGEGIFSILGIKITDFLIAGGILLLTVSISDIFRYGEKAKISAET